MFSSEGQWLNHIKAEHITGNWVCRIRSHTSTFKSTSEQEFREHLETEHKDAVPRSQLDAVVRGSYRLHPDRLLFGDQCPFGCPPESKQPLPQQTKQMDPLPRHIANLLLSLALESLPVRDDDKSSKAEEFEESDDSESPHQQKARKLSQGGVSDVSIDSSWGEPEKIHVEDYETAGLLQVQSNDYHNDGNVSREIEWGAIKPWPRYVGLGKDPKLEKFRLRLTPAMEPAPFNA
jgi:hypothetical protein